MALRTEAIPQGSAGAICREWQKMIKHPMQRHIGYFIFDQTSQALCFWAFGAWMCPLTSMDIGNLQVSPRHPGRYFFVECSELRVLPFSLVGRERHYRSREILTFSFAGRQD
jgi:hypothetical protein